MNPINNYNYNYNYNNYRSLYNNQTPSTNTQKSQTSGGLLNLSSSSTSSRSVSGSVPLDLSQSSQGLASDAHVLETVGAGLTTGAIIGTMICPGFGTLAGIGLGCIVGGVATMIPHVATAVGGAIESAAKTVGKFFKGLFK